MMRLLIEDDAGNVRVVPLGEDPVTIGRAPDNTLVLADRNVSRHHARIRLDGGRLLLADAGSRYGIRLDGERLVQEVEIRAGDVFLAGDYRLKVLAPDSALADAAPESAAERARHATAVGMRAMSVEAAPVDTTNDFGMMTLQEMEEVARLGWRSDFHDEDEPVSPWRTAGRILLMLVLVLLAAGLGFAYYKLYVAEDEVLVQPRVHAMPSASVGTEAAGAPRAAPPPAAGSRDEPTAARRGPDPVPTTARAPATAARRTAAEPSPASATPVGDDLLTSIDGALASGDLSEAERLVAQCSVKGCFRRVRALGDAFKSRGESARALDAYRRALRMTQEPDMRDRVVQSIQALGGTPE